jgi:L-ascorbate metabolism protein UlaG (beta-lactamase superfamily)
MKKNEPTLRAKAEAVCGLCRAARMKSLRSRVKKILMIMAAMFCGAAGASAAEYPSDVINTAYGGELKITFFGHGSIAFEYDGKHIYIDPVSDFADYASLPKADIILVGHEHGDHLDPKAIEALSKPETAVIGNGTAVESLGYGDVLEYGRSISTYPSDLDPADWVFPIVNIEAVPAYNTSPEKLNFHPKDRKHNGYILTFGETRVYVAGDTEDTPEMMALKDIDIAFLPVNLPYTMTEEQAARAVKAIRPKIFYPYHYGGVEHRTDLAKLEKLLEGSGVEMRVRPLE